MVVVFFYPSKNIGGVQTLFYRIGKQLSDSFDVCYVDEIDGFYTQSGVRDFATIVNTTSSFNMFNTKDVVVILPPSEIIKAKKYFQGGERMFMWHVHPYNTISFIPGFNLFTKFNKNKIRLLLNVFYRRPFQKLKALLLLAIQKKSLFFMDGANLEVFDYFYSNNIKPKKLIPIPVFCPKHEKKTVDISGEGQEKVVWVGRIEHFKASILDFVIQEFLALKDVRERYIFVVVGDGIELERFILKYKAYPCIHFVGTYSPNQLSLLLNENIKISFCMGTAALETAKMSIPTILLDAFYNEVPDTYKFKWLYESPDFNLGKVIDKSVHGYFLGEKLLNVFNELDDREAEVSIKCFDYVNSNHNINGITKLVANSIADAELTFNDIPDFEGDSTFRFVKIMRDFSRFCRSKGV